MAAPSGNNITNGALNLNSASQPAPVATPLTQQFVFNHGHNIYIRAGAEFHLFTLWMTLPHPEIHIAFYREVLETTVGLPSSYIAPPELKRAVEADITDEQERRFALVAQTRDIEYMRDMLGWLRGKLVEIQGVLQAQLEDEMADFDGEDFKRMEKEDERFGEQKQKQKKEVSTADSSF